uniref:Serpin domain-containing protein n=1 Tax=Anopheles farauti TaxID=69004 RepID=A0A182Q8V5_9DIPT
MKLCPARQGAPAKCLLLLMTIGAVAGQIRGGGGGYLLPQQPRRPSNPPPVSAPVLPTNQEPRQQARLQKHGGDFRYNPASAAVTELARSIGAILGQQYKAAVFSPVSIASALSLMLIGAERHTKSELIHVLGFQQYAKHLDNIHQLYSDMLNDLARTEFDLVPPPWRTANPCYEPDDEEDDGADAYALTKDVIRVANAVFIQDQQRLNASFRYYSQRYYNSTAASVPFTTNPSKAAALINEWARRNTNGKIREILSESVAAEADVIVASALYFKGLWSEPFEVQATEQKPFYPDGHGHASKSVTTMSTVGCYPYYESRELDAKIVGLSYQGNKTAMYIIMPNNSTRQKMQLFQQKLTPAMIGELVANMAQRKMYLQLPKMQITNTINLRDVLQRLGLRTIFNRDQSDLSGMVHHSPPIELFQTRFGETTMNGSFLFPDEVYYATQDSDTRRGSGATPTSNGNQNSNGQSTQQQQPVPDIPLLDRTPGPPLHVSEFIHRVELDINEKGTEGGAITTSTIFRALPSIHMRVDAPFLLLLGHDETRLPLFYGTIYDPTP